MSLCAIEAHNLFSTWSVSTWAGWAGIASRRRTQPAWAVVRAGVAVPHVKLEEAAVQRERLVQATPASAVVAVPRAPPEGVAVQHGQPAAVMLDARPVGTVAVVPHGRSNEGAAVPHGRPDEGAAVRE